MNVVGYGLNKHQKNVIDSDHDNLDFFWPRPYWRIAKLGKKPNLTQEGRRDFLNTPKCAQCPHLYTTYEATYGLKSLLFEIFAKN